MSKCKVCRTEFAKKSIAHKTCSVECAQELVKTEKAAKAEKEERVVWKLRKENAKSRAEWLVETQQVFNAWIRERDKLAPCISCGRHHTGQFHAGHYRSVGAAPELRFNENNCQKQCAPCNNHRSGNVVEYRIHLVKKIGIELVEWLEGAHLPKKYTIDELKAIKAEYKKRLKEIKDAA